ncbi:MAG: cobalt ECF transporter T component CbiQ [Deltaproteobacteria bacterium]|nr:cobalt ECF transporter T component CbiQ [Deltaproteobacteria bacterium]
MTSSITTVTLPLNMMFLTAGGLAISLILLFWLVRKCPVDGNRAKADEEKNWGIPAIDSLASISSPFHNWDPRIRIVSLIIFIFCLASLTRISLVCFSLFLAVLAASVARVSLKRTLGRLRAMSAFLGLLLLVMPLTVPDKNGDIIYVFIHLDFFKFNQRGILLALAIILKAFSIALMTEPLLATSKLSVTIQALARLKVPRMACQMILLAHRYIFVFQSESVRMLTGMKARGFQGRTDIETLRSIGNFLGMLLVRSFARTQKVYDAMLARGYTGKLPVEVEFNAQPWDWAKGAFWIISGLGLLLLDKIWNVPGV